MPKKTERRIPQEQYVNGVRDYDGEELSAILSKIPSRPPKPVRPKPKKKPAKKK